MNWFWILVCIIALIVLIFIIKHFKNPRNETINCITGGLGGGKTSSGICRIFHQLRCYYFLYRNKKIKKDYIVLANYPMGKLEKVTGKHYIRIWFKKIYCYDLDPEILTLKKKLPQDEVIIVIDEFSNYANQFDFNNPLISNNVLEFVRLFRHYTHDKGYIYALDQCSCDLFLQIRRRMNYCYNMIHCFKVPLLPIVIYEYRKILLSDEVNNTIDVEKGTDETDIRKFIFFVNPFKYYDSCYMSDRYNAITQVAELKNFESMKKLSLFRMPYNKIQYYETLKFDGITEEEFIENFNKKNKKK